MDTLYAQLCSYPNLYLAYSKARKGKTQKPYVLEFEHDLAYNLLTLQGELISHTYYPLPLQEFVIRDPKTRRINRSAFRDRIVHHALCLIIEPLFEHCFIYDSYANRKGKGVLKALERYRRFLQKVSYNYSKTAFVLKADIKKYFETVPHNQLISILHQKIKDEDVLLLIKNILSNYCRDRKAVGMPLGNLTSQFFANVYLNELDQFVKHNLKAHYYIRYVDDFVLLHHSATTLKDYKVKIAEFLAKRLALQLHPDKSKIMPAEKGVDFLGVRMFLHHTLLKKKNIGKFRRKYVLLSDGYDKGKIEYDSMYDFMEGWIAHAKYANTYKLRKKVLSHFEFTFPKEISSKEVNRNRLKNKREYKS